MKIFEVTETIITRTKPEDVAKMKNIHANVKQAQAAGDADAGFKAGAELGDMLMNKVYPDMLQVITKMVNELEIACKKYADDPRWAKACKELPKVKADLKKQRMATYGQGQGRQDIGEVATAGGTSAGSIATVNNPHVAHSKKKPKKQKPTDNALDMKGTSIFGGPAIKR